MKHYEVKIAYTVYVEVDDGYTQTEIEEIAVEYLDEQFAHARNVTVNEITDDPDDFTFRLQGWAVDEFVAEREP